MKTSPPHGTAAIARRSALLFALLLFNPTLALCEVRTAPPASKASFTEHSGVILVDVDSRSGKVRRAKMLQSTGIEVCDTAAVTGFLTRGQFKPGTKSQIKVPVRFRLHSNGRVECWLGTPPKRSARKAQ